MASDCDTVDKNKPGKVIAVTEQFDIWMLS